jgi:hypothetical protein
MTWALLDPTILLIDVESVPCGVWVEAYSVLTGQSAPETIRTCR